MYRAKIHQKNLEALSRSNGKLTTKLMARVLSMWLDAKTEDDRKMVIWSKKMLTSMINGTKVPIKPQAEDEKETPAVWNF